MSTRGFTLIELIVVLVIVSILATIGIPSFSAQISKTKVKSVTLGLLEAVELTRTKAVSINQRTTMRKLDTWENGWEIFIDNNNNGIRDGNEKLLQAYGKTQGVRIIANQPIKNYISYVGTGRSRLVGTANAGGFQAGTFKVCPTSQGEGYKLVLSAGGRMRMAKLNVSECM